MEQQPQPARDEQELSALMQEVKATEGVDERTAALIAWRDYAALHAYAGAWDANAWNAGNPDVYRVHQ